MKKTLQTAILLATAAVPLYAANSIWISDPADMGDSSGDIRSISASVRGDFLVLNMTVQGVAAPTVDQTPTDMSNRYYYHWLLDTDNNPATGRSNAEYEGNSTGVSKPVGSERVIQIGWRNGKPDGVYIYDPLDDENALLTGQTFLASGNTLTTLVPLSAIGLSQGQTIAVSAFQEGASENWKVDWVESAALTLEGPISAVASVTDPVDMGDTSGDIRRIGAHLLGDHLFLWMTVEGLAAPTVADTPEGMVNRYYYHWLLDTDNNPATGRSNSEYEGTPTGLSKPIGAERVIQIGWRDNKPNGVYVYEALNDDNHLLDEFSYQASGNTLAALVPLSALGLTRGQTAGFSAFQEGASEGWKVDWVESAPLTLEGPELPVALVSDPEDMGDSSGDIRTVAAYVLDGALHLRLSVHGVAAPAVDQTPEGMVNRYYYHWLLDTDNNPATGRSNSEYEGNPTGLTKPLGAERVIQIGWRNDKPDGVYVYDALNDDNTILPEYTYHASGNTLSAVIPLNALGLSLGQTIALSAFQEGASEGWKVDWIESAPLTLQEAAVPRAPVAFVDDPQDLGDSNGDIKRIEATLDGTNLVLRMSVHGHILPAVEETAEGMVNRHYYHWLLDTDNNPATGRSNSEYEGNPTGLSKPIGAERVVQIGWRNGAADGVYVYDPLNDEVHLIDDFPYTASDDTVEARLPLTGLGLIPGQTIAFSAFQEGASEGWKVDWVESAVLTLSKSALPGISLETVFTGNAYGFEIRLQDQGNLQADPNSATAALDGAALSTVQGTKAGGVTTVTGRFPTLLPAQTTHTVRLSIKVGDAVQSRDYVFQVEPYTVLSAADGLQSVNQSNRGFLVYLTQITMDQSTVVSLHSNIAELAERQLSGQFTFEGTTDRYANEANQEQSPLWKGSGYVAEGVVNWFELAPGVDTSINFPGDEPIPNVVRLPAEGIVVEILTYLELTAGSHKLGLYSEGGHKITQGLTPTGGLISLFDNSGYNFENPVGDPPVPTYFGRNQFFDLVALEPGYYPIRILWFQSKRRQEPGLLLELFSVKDRALHLLNSNSDPLSIKTYRAGPLLQPGVEVPSLSIVRSGATLTLSWQGTGFKLQSTSSLSGPWADVATVGNSHSPAISTGNQFFRLIKP